MINEIPPIPKLTANKVYLHISVKDTAWDTIYADRVSARVIPADRSERRHGIGHGLDNLCNQPCNSQFTQIFPECHTVWYTV